MEFEVRKVKRYFILFLVLLLLAVLADYETLVLIVPLAALLIFLGGRQAFRLLLRVKLLAFLAFLAFGVPVFAGSKDAVFMGIPYSAEIFRMSVVMVFRSLIILMAVKMFTSRISVEQMAAVFHRIRLRQFSLIFSLAMGMLPQIRRITLNTFREVRRTRPGWIGLPAIFDGLVTLLVRIIAFAESCQEFKFTEEEMPR